MEHKTEFLGKQEEQIKSFEDLGDEEKQKLLDKQKELKTAFDEKNAKENEHTELLRKKKVAGEAEKKKLEEDQIP